VAAALVVGSPADGYLHWPRSPEPLLRGQQLLRVAAAGEDVGHYGGSYKVTYDLYKKYGDMRLLDTPICGEAAPPPPLPPVLPPQRIGPSQPWSTKAPASAP